MKRAMVVIGALLVAATVAAFALKSEHKPTKLIEPDPGVSLANYNRVKEGMHLFDLPPILGEPSEVIWTGTGTEGRIYHYRDGSKRITLTLSYPEYKVVSKEKAGLD